MRSLRVVRRPIPTRKQWPRTAPSQRIKPSFLVPTPQVRFYTLKPTATPKVETPQDPAVFNKKINSLLDKGDAQGAIAEFDKMVEVGVDPNADTFASLFRHFFKINQDKVGVLLQRGSPKPNAFRYNSVVSALAMTHRFDAADKVRAAMAKDGMAPDAFTYNTLVSALAEKGMLEKAKYTLSDMQKNNISPDEFALNDLLAATIAAGNPAEVAIVLSEMEKANVKPFDKHRSGYLVLMGNSGEFEAAANYYSKFEPSSFNSEANIKMIEVCGNLGKIGESNKVFNFVLKNFPKKAKSAYNALIKANIAVGNMTEAEKITEKMAAEKIQPTEDSFLPIITAYTKSQNHPQAIELAKKALALEILLSEENCNKLLESLSYGKVADTKRVLELMELNNRKISSDALVKIVEQHIRNSRRGDAMDILYSYEKNQGTNLSETQYNTILRLVSYKLNESLRVMNRMDDKGYKPTFDIFEEIFGHLEKSHQVNEVMNLFERMTQHGYIPTPNMIHVTAQVYCNTNRPVEALEFYKSKFTSEMDDIVTPTEAIYKTILTCLLKKEMFEKGRDILQKMKSENIPFDLEIRRLEEMILTKLNKTSAPPKEQIPKKKPHEISWS